MESVVQDLRYAVRVLFKNPGFTAVAVLSLAIGIGANSTIFSLVNALLLRPLPVDKPQELVALYTSDYSGPLYGTSSYPDYADFRDRNDVFSGLVAYQITPFSISTDTIADRLFGEVVSGNYFDVLGVKPIRGRSFLPEEDKTPMTHPVAVISYSLWQRSFGGDQNVAGRSVTLNGKPFTIVGVAPENYKGIQPGLAADLWVPMMMQGAALPGSEDLTNRGDRSTFVIGRLKPGVTLDQTQAQFNVIAQQLHQSYSENWTDVRQQPRVVTLVRESEATLPPQFRGVVIGFFAVLMGVVGLVLLIACANVANMLLAQSASRRKEIAIRLALGAGRKRLVRQLLTESLLLATFASGLGLLLALWGNSALAAFKPPVGIPFELNLSIDGRVIAFTFVVSCVTALLFGLAPALSASRARLAPALKEEAGGGAASGSRRIGGMRSAFVIAQVALSLLLLLGAGLLVRSLRNAIAIDPGFDPENLLIASMDLRLQGYNDQTGTSFYRQLLEQARSIPGVEAASLVVNLPLGLDTSRRGITIEGYNRQDGEDMEVATSTVGPGYFEAMRIPMMRGRGFNGRDVEGGARVAIVNETFARRYWRGEDPIGKHIQMGVVRPDRNAGGNTAPQWEIIGVAKDGKYSTLGEEPKPFFYMPLLQFYRSDADVILRTRDNPLKLLTALRREVQALDKTLPLLEPKTMIEHLGISLLPARLAGSVLGTFGVVALFLAALGIYGVMAYAVSERTREIGIRIALGATRADILRLVGRRGLLLVGTGCALGLGAALALTRVLSDLLYGISATDPATFAGVIAILGLCALLACYVPARRATKVDPVVALRYE